MNILIEKNIMVPMRDGVRLATDVYRPVEGGPAPVLLSRLAYNKELPATIQAAIDTSRAVQVGYAVFLQDCRGRFGSEGEFTPIVNETSDGVDTVAWIAQQPTQSLPWEEPFSCLLPPASIRDPAISAAWKHARMYSAFQPPSLRSQWR